jgi:hypothetical protein
MKITESRGMRRLAMAAPGVGGRKWKRWCGMRRRRTENEFLGGREHV